MCGICGAIVRGAGAQSPEAAARAMADAVAHRGPDDFGVWCDEGAGVALAHRRLSIVDLSALGHQPMASAGGRYHVTLNGEIYNYRDLRAQLQGAGHRFRGHSDTEVLLAAVEQWGVPGAATRCVGMFAFAIWDRGERLLHLVRDRIGEKPLYYGRLGDAFLFGSELKALQAHPAWTGRIDQLALAQFLQFNYVPSPRSIFEGVRKLVPGTILTVRAADLSFDEPRAYWSAAEAVAGALADPFTGTPAEASAELERLLAASVRQQMVADVPLGALLSGGIDSSTVVAVMQSLSPAPIRTFTVGFTADAYNEAAHAKAVAAHLGTDHTEAFLAPRDAMEIIVDLPEIYDEPFADSSQIPAHLVSRVARRHVTVALSGDGGDELFGGYNRYTVGPRLWGAVRAVPAPLRAGLAALLSLIPPALWRRTMRALSPVLPRGSRQVRLDEKIEKVAGVLRARDAAAVYGGLVAVWPRPPVAGGGFTETAWPTHPAVRNFAAKMMFADLLTYLPDDILAKVDRAAMRVGLETRVPFLDHRIVQFAWRVPTAMHVHSGVGKRVLRDVLHRHVPRALVERPKMGFSVPVGEWIRGELRDWAESLLSPTRLRNDGLLDAAPIRAAWHDHRSGARDATPRIWGVLMFQAWLDETRRRGALS